MEDLIHMDNNEKFTFWVVTIGVLVLIGYFAYIIVRNIKQKKKREAFSQNYNVAGIVIIRCQAVSSQTQRGSATRLIRAAESP